MKTYFFRTQNTQRIVSHCLDRGGRSDKLTGSCGERNCTHPTPPSARSDFPIEFRLNYGPTVLQIRPREPFDIREKGERERRRVFLPNLGYPDAFYPAGGFSLSIMGVSRRFLARFVPAPSSLATEFGKGANPITSSTNRTIFR